jgi:cytoskeletal protein CcmA (bactofilin family)
MFSKAKKKANGTGGAGLPVEKAAGAPMPAQPVRRQASGVPSIISADLTIEGNLISHGDLQVDGTIQGDIRSRTLTLGEHAQVHGGVEADTVRICGEVEGEVRAKTVVLTKTAKVTGDVIHESLAVEAGAYIDGHCRRDTVDAAATSAPKPVADEPAPAPKLSNGDAKAAPAPAPAKAPDSEAKAG